MQYKIGQTLCSITHLHYLRCTCVIRIMLDRIWEDTGIKEATYLHALDYRSTSERSFRFRNFCLLHWSKGRALILGFSCSPPTILSSWTFKSFLYSKLLVWIITLRWLKKKSDIPCRFTPFSLFPSDVGRLILVTMKVCWGRLNCCTSMKESHTWAGSTVATARWNIIIFMRFHMFNCLLYMIFKSGQSSTIFEFHCFNVKFLNLRLQSCFWR